MSLIKWKKEDDLFPLLNSFFDDFWGRDFVSGIQTGTSVPAVNITETSEAFDILVAAPGMKKEDFKIDLDNGMLTISSEKKEEKETIEKRITRKEYNFSSFQRSFSLPNSVSTDKINASYNDGILSIVLPKKEEAKEQSLKQIEVK